MINTHEKQHGDGEYHQTHNHSGEPDNQQYPPARLFHQSQGDGGH